MKIIAYNEEQNYGIEDNNNIVYSAIVCEKYYYHRHKHRGTLQTSLRQHQFLVASQIESDIYNYISDNNLIKYVEPENIENEKD